MPSKSEAQRELFAIAEHEPDKIYEKNKGLTKLPHKVLHEFASSKIKSLPKKVSSSKGIKR